LLFNERKAAVMLGQSVLEKNLQHFSVNNCLVDLLRGA